jgi:hypothetical protein
MYETVTMYGGQAAPSSRGAERFEACRRTARAGGVARNGFMPMCSLRHAQLVVVRSETTPAAGHLADMHVVLSNVRF